MKNVVHLLAGFTLSVIFSQPALSAPAAGSAADEQTTPADCPECQARALKITCYYTDALRLNQSQAAAVRLATQQEFAQLEQADPAVAAQAVAQYDAAMLRILTPGQYSAYHLLQERQTALGPAAANQLAHK